MLNLLHQQYDEINHSIENILNAMEKGITTNATKKRLESLEEQQAILSEKIEIEKNKEKLRLTKENIIDYFEKALKKRPKLLIDLLIREVIIYNDKIEIFYNYTDKSNNPEDDSPRDCCFYSFEKSYTIDKHRLNIPAFVQTYKISLFL